MLNFAILNLGVQLKEMRQIETPPINIENQTNNLLYLRNDARECKLVLFTRKKLQTGFRLPKAVTLNDLKRCNGRYCELFTEFGSFSGASLHSRPGSA